MIHLKYFWYILRHKWYVFVECCRLGIPWQGVTHDLSKLRLSEWMPYARYFYGKWTKQGVEKEFDIAWLHHQKRNKHHWQYWVLLEDSGGMTPMDMPLKYRKEMLADWRGAGRAITGKNETKQWYLHSKDNMMLHPETRAWIEANLCRALQGQG